METKRVFLVGCPRSGTTLYQSMIASHSQVVSFPETHFFSKTLPINPALRRLKLYGPPAREMVKQFLDNNGYNKLNPFSKLSSYTFFTHNQWCQKLLDILDQLIIHNVPENGNHKSLWGLEKTPRHLHYISSIEQPNTSNKFLHILRQGKDVVASLHLATKQFPKEWGGERSVKQCVRWWNDSLKESLKYRSQSNHFFVTYEQLLEAPDKVLQATSQFLQLDYESSMVQNFHQTAGALTKDEEEWKERNARKSLNKSNKFRTFDSSTIRYIRRNTVDVDLTEFYH